MSRNIAKKHSRTARMDRKLENSATVTTNMAEIPNTITQFQTRHENTPKHAEERKKSRKIIMHLLVAWINYGFILMILLHNTVGIFVLVR